MYIYVNVHTRASLQENVNGCKNCVTSTLGNSSVTMQLLVTFI